MKRRQMFPYSQLAQRFKLNPNSRCVGLFFDQKCETLNAVYLAKESEGGVMPWCGMITKGPWDLSDDGEEFFLEALSFENLLDRLERFIEPEHFIFFEVPASIGMDVVSKYPAQMFSTLFTELSDLDPKSAKAASLSLLKKMASTLSRSL